MRDTRFFLGAVGDKDRLYRALDGVDYLVHTAALCRFRHMRVVGQRFWK